MRLEKYINEKYDDIEEIIEIIKRDCKPFLKEMKDGELLWRGTNKPVDNIIEIIPRKDRRPKDTNIKAHKWLDSLFLKYYGWKARSEGVFADSRRSTFFGKPYLFFPIGRYKYLWSDKITDLTSYLIMIKDRDVLLWTELIGRSDIVEDIKKEYTNKDLIRFSKRGYGEVMFKCKSYYLVDDYFYDKLLRLLN